MSEDIDRTDEFLELMAEEQRRDELRRNGFEPDDPGPIEPDDDPYENIRLLEEQSTADTNGEYSLAIQYEPPPLTDADTPPASESTTWDPFDLWPYLRGEITQPQPTLGISRSDGVRLIYPGREHALVGETESGKTWLALMCAAAELLADNYVLYIHYEEGDPASTIERLRLLGVDNTTIAERLKFVAPMRPLRTEWLPPLLNPAPSLVIHDGVNEAMSLQGADIKDADGAARFRRQLIMPCLLAGAATIACDHMPMNADAGRRDAYGSVHKGNALNGARILLQNKAPFGRRMRGVSYVFVTKDRPGYLRANGKASSDAPGKTFFGTFVVDDSQQYGPDFSARFFAPKDGDDELPGQTRNPLADGVVDVITALPDSTVSSTRMLYAELRKAGIAFTDKLVRDTVDDLIVKGQLKEVPGPNNAAGYQVISANDYTSDSSASDGPAS